MPERCEHNQWYGACPECWETLRAEVERLKDEAQAASQEAFALEKSLMALDYEALKYALIYCFGKGSNNPLMKTVLDTLAACRAARKDTTP